MDGSAACRASTSARTAKAMCVSASRAIGRSWPVPWNRSWPDRVDENLVGRQLEGERFGQRDDAGLGDVVRNIARIARPAAARNPVAEIDDVAAAGRSHVRRGGMRAEERAAKVDVD